MNTPLSVKKMNKRLHIVDAYYVSIYTPSSFIYLNSRAQLEGLKDELEAGRPYIEAVVAWGGGSDETLQGEAIMLMHEAVKNIKSVLLKVFDDQEKPISYFADKHGVSNTIIKKALNTDSNTCLQTLVNLADSLGYEIKVDISPKDPESVKTCYIVVLATTPMEVREALNPVKVE